MKLQGRADDGSPVFCEAASVTEYFNENTGRLLQVCATHADKLNLPEYVAAGWQEA
jgi:hypothetical protein